jgi:amino acid transporter
MATHPDEKTPDPVHAADDTALREALEQTYTRKATGLVRELGPFDIFAFAAAVSTPLGIVLATTIFIVDAAFPGANILLDLGLCFVLLPLIWIPTSLLAAAMPGVGGDYLIVSRILNPVAGIFSNICAYTNSLLSVALVAYLFVQEGIVTTLGIVGIVGGGQGWINASHTVASKGWTFAIGTALVLFVSALSVTRTKVVARVMAWGYYIALVGILASIVILLLTSHHHFVSVVNQIGKPYTKGGGAYAATIAAGQKSGTVLKHFSSVNTLGALFSVTLALNATWYNIYLNSETKSAGRRGRQLMTQAGVGYFQLVVVVFAVLIIFHTAGQHFILAASNGSFPAPVSPYLNFFASAIAGGSALAIILGLAFLFAFPPWLYGNLAMCQRLPFAWAFDGLLPRVFTKVNPRTHTPVLSIAITAVICVGFTAWAAFGTSFIELVTYTGITGLGTLFMLAISGIVMRKRRPALYDGSPADWRIAGVRVLGISSVGYLGFAILFTYLLFRFHTNLGIKNSLTAILVVAAEAVVSVMLYYGARAVQRRRGVDIELAYRDLPVD